MKGPSVWRWLRAILVVSGALGLGILAPVLTEAASRERSPVLVLKNGRSFAVRSWEEKGNVTHVTALDGTVQVVKTSEIDFEKTRRATEVAMRPPTPTPTPKKEKTIVEVAREMAEERRRRQERESTPPPPALVTPPPLVSQTAPGGTPAATPELVAAVLTPEPTPEPAATPTPTPAPVGTQATPEPTPPPKPPPPAGLSPVLVWGGGAAALVVLAGVVLALRKRSAAPGAKRPSAPVAAPAAAAAAAPARDELLTPAFASDDAELPMPAPIEEEVVPARAELGGASAEQRALPAGPAALPAASILEDGREIQIRIGADVYTAPDLASLKRWVEEGRVIETSEILAPDGTWLLAGSIPDLEPAFERRRETQGY